MKTIEEARRERAAANLELSNIAIRMEGLELERKVANKRWIEADQLVDYFESKAKSHKSKEDRT